MLESLVKGGTSDSQIYLNKDEGIILFRPDFKAILNKVNEKVAHEILRRKETPGSEIMDTDDFVSIGGIKLEKNKAMALIH